MVDPHLSCAVTGSVTEPVAPASLYEGADRYPIFGKSGEFQRRFLNTAVRAYLQRLLHLKAGKSLKT